MEHNVGLEALFSPPRDRYTDDDLEFIRSLLPAPENKIPRLYTILRHLKCLPDLATFLRGGVSDTSIPFHPTQLPSEFSEGWKMRFCEKQGIVCNHSMAVQVLTMRQHMNFLEPPTFLISHGSISRGPRSSIDKVGSILGGEGRLYARKQFYRRQMATTDKEAMSSFELEVGCLRKLDHRHCVRLVASFTEPGLFTLVMDPVADSNLARYLEDAFYSDEKRSMLPQFFGCLARGLWYIHRNQLRHRDVKTENILVHRNNVLFTDFDCAYQWAHTLHSSTNQPPPRTPKWASPEVAKSGYQENTHISSKSDVWSLGCVFLEIATVMKRKSVRDLEEFVGGADPPRYHDQLERVDLWIKETSNVGNRGDSDNAPLEWARSMLQEQESDRPTSHKVTESTMERSQAYLYCCDRCYNDDTQLLNPNTDATSAPGSNLATRGSHSSSEFEESEEAGRAAHQLRLSGFPNLDEPGALMWAARSGNEPAVRLLLSKGVDVNARDSNRWTSLHFAVKCGRESVARLLLEKQADVDAHEGGGWTALHSAAEQGSAVLCRLLLANGANVNAKSRSGKTPLHKAAESGSSEVTRLLLEKGADVQARDDKLLTALHIASVTGHNDVALLLLERDPDINGEDDRGATPLHYAASAGQTQAAKLLLTHDAQINHVDRKGGTALFWAATNGHLSTVELLLEHEADVSTANYHGWTAILRAVEEGDLPMVSLLLKKVDIEQKSGDGRTALHMAAVHGHVEITKVLLQNQADTGAKDWNDWTPLHWAADRGNAQVAQLLLDYGADKSGLNRDRWTPVQLAEKRGHVSVARLLRSTAVVGALEESRGRTILDGRLCRVL